MTSPCITAPGGFCDDATRRTSHLARGLVRGSIPDLFHEFCGEHANAAPRLIPAAVLPAQLGVSGLGRGALSICSPRGVICQDFRASQHLNFSVKNSPRGSSYRVEVPGCGKSHLEIEKLRRVA